MASTEEKKLDWAEDAASSGENSKEAPQEQKDGATEFMNGSSSGVEEPEFDVNVTLADLQEDPNNPLYSAKTFEQLNLREELLKGLSVMNFRKPSKIQERALPLLLKEPAQNLIGQSQSGTGKTAAFVLNMLSRIDINSTAPQCIVLAPTRELAKQIAGVASVMGTFLIPKGLKVTEAVPDASLRGQQYEGQIIVGTPGTTMDLIKRKTLNVREVKVLTLDEADNMLDLQGLGDQCKRVKKLLPQNVQVVLFSATFPEKVLQFASVFAPNANQLTLEVQKLTVDGIQQYYVDLTKDEDKYHFLVQFYSLLTVGSSIIFVNRRDTAVAIEKRMTAEGHRVASLTGALEGSERDAVFDRFRKGDAKVLITTNVLARGIDVKTVTLVINYNLPELMQTTGERKADFETYLHRIGRTGRFGRTGVALSFLHDEASYKLLEQITQHFNITPKGLDSQDPDGVEKELKKYMKNSRNT